MPPRARGLAVRASVLALACLLGPGALGAQGPARPPAAPTIALVNVTVVDVEEGRLLPARTVLVRGSRIEATGPASMPLPAGARVLDGTGGFLVPGLWDLHVHALRNGRVAWMFPLFLAEGVLGIRDTGSPLDSLLRYRREVASGKVLGPRVLGSGPLLDGPGGQWPDFTVSIATAEAGRRAVDSLADGGVDYVKVYDGLPRDAFFAIAERARLRHLPVIGHVPRSVTALEASDAGMRSQEHMTMAPACIPALPRLFGEAEAYTRRPGVSPDSVRIFMRRLSLRASAAYDDAVCRSVGATLARNGTFVVPTLARERTWSRAYLGSPAAGKEPELRYVPLAVRSNWDRWRDSVVAARSPDDIPEEAARYNAYLLILRALRASGVGVLPGTDTDGNDAFYYGVPGFALHTELETLVRDVGFTPAEALRAATLGAARFLGLADSLGTVASGKMADLVLLDADPLADIANTRRIRAVLRAGQLLDRAALDALLAGEQRPVPSDPGSSIRPEVGGIASVHARARARGR